MGPATGLQYGMNGADAIAWQGEVQRQCLEVSLTSHRVLTDFLIHVRVYVVDIWML